MNGKLLLLTGFIILILGALALASASSAVNCFNSNPNYASSKGDTGIFNSVNVGLAALQIVISFSIIYAAAKSP